MQVVRTAPKSAVVRRRLPLVAIGMLILFLALGPALVASSVTARQQPTSFLSQPWRGWQLIGAVVHDAPTAELPSPGSALERARATWPRTAGFEPTRARLIYIPGDERVSAKQLTGSAGDDQVVTAGNSLAWIVEGTDEHTGTRGERVLGVLDYSSGEIRYDARQREEELTP